MARLEVLVILVMMAVLSVLEMVMAVTVPVIFLVMEVVVGVGGGVWVSTGRPGLEASVGAC